MIEMSIHHVSAYDDICWTLCFDFFDSFGTRCPAVLKQCFAVFFLNVNNSFETKTLRVLFAARIVHVLLRHKY